WIEGLDRRSSQNGRRALNWAAINNRVDAIRFLLAHGAAIEATNFTGFTALHHAAEYGSLDAARVLLAAGADPKHTNLEGVTPLARARQEGHLDVAELLEARRARRQTKRPVGPYCFDRAASGTDA